MNTHKTRNVAVVCGGYSGEYAVSLRSADGILRSLDTSKYTPYQVVIEEGRWYALVNQQEYPINLTDFSISIPSGAPIPLHYAFITIHGTPGENGLLQGYLDMVGIPYNTGGVLCESITFDKEACKNYLAAFGVRSARAVRLSALQELPQELENIQSLGLPLFVKPNAGGSSVATCKVTEWDQLSEAVKQAFTEDNEVLVERFISGTEVTCGCVTTQQGTRPLAVTEVVVDSNRFFDFDAKYHGESQEITPARISSSLYQEIEQLTMQIALWVRAKGIIRVDYIIESDGRPTLLEVNTTPGMTPTSFIPQQVAYKQESLQELFTEIIESAF